MSGRSTAVAKQEPASVPALVQPRLEISAEDVALPRVYIGQFISQAVTDGLVSAGDIYTAVGKDDPDPEVLAKAGSETGILFHVLGLKKSKSVSSEGELTVWDFNDPDAPPEANTVYQYFVALPEVGSDIPYRLLLSRSGAAAAKQINMVLMRNEAAGPSWQVAFRLTTAKRQNDKGTYYVPRVATVEADAGHVKIAESLAVLISSASTEPRAPADEPAI